MTSFSHQPYGTITDIIAYIFVRVVIVDRVGLSWMDALYMRSVMGRYVKLVFIILFFSFFSYTTATAFAMALLKLTS